MSVLAAIAVLALLIVVHELGHFAAARLQGIYANRFSIGFGPVIWKYQGPQTEYALRAFPLGGFVGFPDDDPDSPIPPDDPNLLRNRPILDRAIVISAGVIANLVFAYLVLLVMLGSVGQLEADNPGVLVPRLAGEIAAVSPEASQAGLAVGDTIFFDGKTVNYTVTPQSTTATLTAEPTTPTKIEVYRKDGAGKTQPVSVTLPAAPTTGVQLKLTPAMLQGLKPGDVIRSANGQPLGQSLREETNFRQLIEVSAGKPIQLDIDRSGQAKTLTLTPEAGPSGDGKIGVALAPNGTIARHPVKGTQLFSLAGDEFQRIVNETLDGFKKLISKFSQTASQVSGPVAIVAVGSKIAQADPSSLFDFTALISINLAIINILPLPALDGGHLAFLFIEGLRGKPLPQKFQEGVMQTGLVLLLSLGVFLILRDTANLIQR